MNKFNINFLISTFFGLGKLPHCIVYVIASLVALPMSYLFFFIGSLILKFLFPISLPFQGTLASLFVLIVFTMIATKAADIYSKKIRSKDPAEIIIDEIIGQSLALLLTTPYTVLKIYLSPERSLAFISNEVLLMIAISINIILFRLFDTFKPWPIYKFEEIKGGLGIIMDDIAAGIFTAIVYFLILFAI